MKSMKMKLEDVVNAFRLLNDAKYQKLGDDDKVKVWKATRALKPMAMQLEEDIQDARQRFIPSEDFNQRLQKAIEYEKLKTEKKEELPMSEAEYLAILADYNKFRDMMKKALDESNSKEVEVSFEPISEEAFGKLMASNDWTFKQVETLEFILDN